MANDVVIIVQARMGSSRLPGKVLREFCGQPLLLWHLDRLWHMTCANSVVVACPGSEENEAIFELCTRHGITCFMTECPEEDVLTRFHIVARTLDAKVIVRTTADCPCIDPSVIDALVTAHQTRGAKGSPGYTGLSSEWGDGFDCEVFSREALAIAFVEAKDATQREHVSPFLWENKARFNCADLACPLDLSNMRCSIDTEEDLLYVSTLFWQCVERYGLNFGWREVWWQAQGNAELLDYMQRRSVMNPAYVIQAGVTSWQEARYGA